jgi:chromosomal replication initiator protein
VFSKFSTKWLEEHYVKIKVALTKELAKMQKVTYKIKMENTYGKQTNQVYGTNCQVQMRNP